MVKTVDGGLRALQAFMGSGPGLGAWLVALLVVAGPVTLLHELGHALVARRLLPGSVRVLVGLGRRRWRFEAGGIEFHVAPLTAPVGPAGECSYDGLPSAREAVAIAAGGPFATAIGLGVSLALLPHVGGRVRDLTWMAVATQACSLLLNLLPLTLVHGGRRIVTDGKAIIDALRS